MTQDIRLVSWRHRGGEHPDTKVFGLERAHAARKFHASFAEYSVTPLARLSGLARAFGVKDIFVKDESRRFGLNAFKVLGGSYAIARVLGERLQLAEEELSCATLAAQKKNLGTLTFVTATDGNHGRGVAWTAQRFGHRAVVFLPKGTAAERVENIRALGAEARLTDVNYDDAVRMARAYAAAHDGIVVQDTSWDGYEDIPRYIMQGYTTMGAEIAEQLAASGGARPTHVFLQAGVGALAGAMACFFADYYQGVRPKIIIVEPHAADCLYRTALADDGALHEAEGALDSIMAGLCCGEPCPLGWEQLAAHADYFVSQPDEAAALGMRVLGNPVRGDASVEAGESGAAGVGLVAALALEKELAHMRRELALDENAVVLCLSTEGATDRENYRRIMWEGAWSWK